VSPQVYLQEINIRKKQEMVCKLKISHPEEIMSLKLAIHMVMMDM
jgi:hypothetical protein